MKFISLIYPGVSIAKTYLTVEIVEIVEVLTIETVEISSLG